FITQHTKHPQTPFTSHHPIKINTYKNPHSTYYLFQPLKNHPNNINNTWTGPKHCEKKPIHHPYILHPNPKKPSILQSSKPKYPHLPYIQTINQHPSIQLSQINYTQPYQITKPTIHTYHIKNYYYI
ncbi:CHAP domain-containing protein, partial [Staphylococcus epidermidis]|uniref:CHAP domain-containing protein n=1 Tax=Staphylococcus epidermidis TaxID=1282 RepID=UPI0021B47232